MISQVRSEIEFDTDLKVVADSLSIEKVVGDGEKVPRDDFGVTISLGSTSLPRSRRWPFGMGGFVTGIEQGGKFSKDDGLKGKDEADHVNMTHEE